MCYYQGEMSESFKRVKIKVDEKFEMMVMIMTQ